MGKKCKQTTKSAKAHVGVVVPTHNNAATIQQTLRSIATQSYRDFEVFIIDDHSEDNTVQIIKKTIKSKPNFHLVILKNERGAAAARNKAIELVTKRGLRYTAFLDGDDLWYPKKLETQVKFMQKTGAPFSYSDYDIFATKQPIKYRTSPNYMSYKRMVLGCSVGCLTVMYDNRVVKKVKIPNLTKRNDYALWCLILKQSRYGLKCPGILASYRCSNSSLSSGKKIHLLKYHYFMHRQVNGYKPIRSVFLTMSNIINYILNIVIREHRL